MNKLKWEGAEDKPKSVTLHDYIKERGNLVAKLMNSYANEQHTLVDQIHQLDKAWLKSVTLRKEQLDQ